MPEILNIPWAEEILQDLLTIFLGQIFADFWHNLYIRRLPGPSPKPLEGFQPTFFEVLQTLRGENLPEKN